MGNVRVYHGYFLQSVHIFMYIMSIRNASPYLIFHDLFYFSIFPGNPLFQYIHEHMFLLFTFYLFYMLSTFNLICVNLNIILKVKLYNVIYIFLTHHYVHC